MSRRFERWRAALQRRHWVEVHRLLGALDPAELDGAELDALADASFAVGDDDLARSARENAQARFVEDGDNAAAASSALLVAMAAILKGELAGNDRVVSDGGTTARRGSRVQGACAPSVWTSGGQLLLR